MQLVWLLCVCLVGRLSLANPAEERPENAGPGYMMAFPMNDDQIAEESAVEAVKSIAEALVDNSKEDEAKPAGEQDKQPVVMLEVEESKGSGNDEEVTIEPMEILQGQLEAEEGTPKPPRRSLFKRPKIEELRKLLGFPQPEEKSKPLPVEKPKAPLGVFNKMRPKTENTPNGLQISLPLRREDRLRPFGFPILPMQRSDAMRPFGFPDLVQAASSILRRAIIDDNNENDISKEDKDDDNDEHQEDMDNNNDENDDDEDDEEEEPMMVMPVPDGKDEPRPSLFRRFPLPLPFPVPRPMQANRPRFPMPPLAPVAFFLPLAHQIMHNIITNKPAPRAQPAPLLPITPVHHLIPLHPPMQNFIVQPQFMHAPQPFFHVQQQQPMPHLVHAPMMQMPQQSGPAPILIPLPPHMPRPILQRPMQRRMPVHPPHPSIARRMPMTNPMQRVPIPQPQFQQMQFIPLMNVAPPMIRRPEPNLRPMPRMMHHPVPPMNPILFMLPMPQHMPMMAQQQQQVPVFHRPPQVPMMHNHIQFIPRPFPVPVPQEDEERIIFVRSDQDEQQQQASEEDQEVVILVPTDEIEAAQRQQVPVQRQFVRPMPAPMSPINKIQLLKELLMARQGNRQMSPLAAQGRSPRIVEIVQQQLRIIPTHHRGQPAQADSNRADSSELYPVYVPYPGQQ